MREFSDIIPADLQLNPIEAIGKHWMLLTAGTPESFNTMTASWGGLGELWFKPVCFCFVRPQRYTYEFMESNCYFTLSFFAKEYRAKMTYCGQHSGRDVNKTKACGLTPRPADKGAVFFDEAKLVLECKKIYFQDIDPKNFLSDSIAEHYQKLDYHRMYVGEITRALIVDE
jgi:flavin reductase (DIM6/NTAB) family NADH-FMN oxidoreductase RutF